MTSIHATPEMHSTYFQVWMTHVMNSWIPSTVAAVRHQHCSKRRHRRERLVPRPAVDAGVRSEAGKRLVAAGCLGGWYPRFWGSNDRYRKLVIQVIQVLLLQVYADSRSVGQWWLRGIWWKTFVILGDSSWWPFRGRQRCSSPTGTFISMFWNTWEPPGLSPLIPFSSSSPQTFLAEWRWAPAQAWS